MSFCFRFARGLLHFTRNTFDKVEWRDVLMILHVVVMNYSPRIPTKPGRITPGFSLDQAWGMGGGGGGWGTKPAQANGRNMAKKYAREKNPL